MIRTFVKFNNKKPRQEHSSKCQQAAKFPTPIRRKCLQTQSASLQSVAKDTLHEFSQLGNDVKKKGGNSKKENLPQIAPWIESFNQQKCQTSNTLPLFNGQIYQQNNHKKLCKFQLLKGNMSRILKQKKCNGYTTFVKYPCQKAIKTEGIQQISQQIFILHKSFIEQNCKDEISRQGLRNRNKAIQDTNKYIAQQTNPVLVKRKHQSLKAYHISNVSKEVQFLRNQIICNIQKQTVVPISVKLSNLNKMIQNKSIPMKPMLRRKFSLRGKFNNNVLHHKESYLLERQEKERQNINGLSYQCSNPLTKVLYHRFMKTVNKSDIKN